MEKISDRIYKMIRNEGITNRAFEQKIGYSNGLISKFIKNGQSKDEKDFTDINGRWLSIIIETFPKYNASWLLTGKGSMLVGESTGTERISIPDPEIKKSEKLKDQLIASLKAQVETLTEYNTILKSK